MEPSPPLLAAALLTVVGAVLVVVGSRVRRASSRFLARASSAQAVVVGLRTQDRPSHQRLSVTYAPVVRFSLPDGQVVQGETRVGSFPAPAQVGEEVTVRYDPGDPSHVALAAGPATGSTLGAALVAVGSLVVVAALLVVAATVLLDTLAG